MASIFSPFASRTLSAAVAALFAMGGSLAAPPAQAGTVDLSPTPPDLTTTVAPNIALTYDDSGSMAFAYMPDSVNTNRQSFAQYTVNHIYYNPNLLYTPPLDKNGNPFPDVPFNAAPINGYHVQQGFGGNTVDLATEYRPTVRYDQDAQKTHVFLNDSYIPNSVKETTGWLGTARHAYYIDAGGTVVDLTKIHDNDISIGGEPRTAAFVRQNFANWYSYYRTRNLMAKTAVSQAFASATGEVQMIWQTIWPTGSYQNGSNYYTNTWGNQITSSTKIYPLKDGIVAGSGTINHKSDFFKWLFSIRSANGTPDRKATIRANNYFISQDKGNAVTANATNPYWNGATGSDAKNLSCRRNFHILVTDGYWNESDTEVTAYSELSGMDKDKESSIYWNVGGTKDNKKSLAAIAYHYWATDLATGIDDNISPHLADPSRTLWPGADYNSNSPWDNKEIYFNPENDPADWQHVSQYIVTLGISGERNYPGDYLALRKGDKSWPTARGDTASALDDMWRAAIVSRGAYFSASDPSALSQSLSQIIRSVASRTSSGVAGSLNTSVLNTGATSFSASYNTSDWSGDIQAHKIEENGDLGASILGFADKLDARDADSRRIATSSKDGDELAGTPFQWSNLDDAEQLTLNTLPGGSTDSNGKARLEWLRGDRSNEGTMFRIRSHLLGAVVNSQPVYVAYPASGYRNYFPTRISGVDVSAPENDAMANDSSDCAMNGTCHSYEQFAYDKRDRRPMIYVAANDGMLHAFDVSQNEEDGALKSSAGKELWSYVPHAIFDKLSAQMPQKDFTFSPTVDGPVVYRDVFFSQGSDKGWHTVLVGSLRLGGRGVYALDITDPEAGNEGEVADKFLWEFTAESAGADPDDPDKENNPANLGFTFGQPNIGRLANGKWVVLVPGGYFPDCGKTGAPTDCDDSIKAAENKFSSLFILDAQTGKLIRELRAGTDDVPSSGLASPVLGDYNNDQVDDVSFAGDLQGNLWRFDLSDPDPDNWQVNLVYQADTSDQQPVTSMPRLFPDSYARGFIVVFGTGKFLGLSDRVSGSEEPVQAVYGIREPGKAEDASWAHDDLVEQEVKEETVTADGHSLTARGITNHAVSPDKGGWYFDLPVNGERVVVTPGALFNTNRVIISSLIPGNNDPCDPSRKGAIMVVNASNGGATIGLDYPPPPSGWQQAGFTMAGTRVNNPPVTGSLPVATQMGGGKNYLPGITMDDSKTISISDSIWRRRSWRLLDLGN